MELEPGPFRDRHDLLEHTGIVPRGYFAALGVEVTNVLDGAGGGLAAAHAELVPALARRLEGEYVADVIPAAVALGPFTDRTVPGDVSGPIAALGAAAVDAQRQHAELPGPDEPEPRTVDPPFEREPPPPGRDGREPREV
jgi:hypothetical protein